MLGKGGSNSHDGDFGPDKGFGLLHVLRDASRNPGASTQNTVLYSKQNSFLSISIFSEKWKNSSEVKFSIEKLVGHLIRGFSANIR